VPVDKVSAIDGATYRVPADAHAGVTLLSA
jgi:hypothetical protein